MNILTSLFPSLLDIVNKYIPSSEDKLKAQQALIEATQKSEQMIMDFAKAEALAQIKVNETEAASADPFTSRWRPFIGWVCGVALAYQFVASPIVSSVYVMYTGHALPVPLPKLDDSLWELLAGMLGLGTLRTYEKVKGVSK